MVLADVSSTPIEPTVPFHSPLYQNISVFWWKMCNPVPVVFNIAVVAAASPGKWECWWRWWWKCVESVCATWGQIPSPGANTIYIVCPPLPGSLQLWLNFRTNPYAPTFIFYMIFIQSSQRLGSGSGSGKAKMVLKEKKAVLWISTGFNADLDPDPGSQTCANPGGSGILSDFWVTKSWIFTWKIYLK